MIKTLLLLLSLTLSNTAYAEIDQPVKTEIIQRCKKQMGEYGALMVKTCVDQDIEAIIGIRQIPEKYNAIVNRCVKTMRDYGFLMIKTCADQDIKAEQALSNY